MPLDLDHTAQDQAPRTNNAPTALRRCIVAVIAMVVFAAGLALGSTLAGSGSTDDAALGTTTATTSGTSATSTAPATSTTSATSTTLGELDTDIGSDATEAEIHPSTPATSPATPAPAPPQPAAPPAESPGPNVPGPGPSTPGPTTPPTTPPPGNPPNKPEDYPTHIPPPGNEQGSGGPTLIIPKLPGGLLVPELEVPQIVHFGHAKQAQITITNTGSVPVTWAPGPGDPGVSWNTGGSTIPAGGSVTVVVTVSGAEGNWIRNTSISYAGANPSIQLRAGNLLNTPSLPYEQLYP